MIERLLKIIASTQAFFPDDELGRMLKEYDNGEIDEESLDLVYAAHKGDTSYTGFLRLAQERDSRRK